MKSLYSVIKQAKLRIDIRDYNYWEWYLNNYRLDDHIAAQLSQATSCYLKGTECISFLCGEHIHKLWFDIAYPELSKLLSIEELLKLDYIAPIMNYRYLNNSVLYIVCSHCSPYQGNSIHAEIRKLQDYFDSKRIDFWDRKVSNIGYYRDHLVVLDYGALIKLD